MLLYGYNEPNDELTALIRKTVAVDCGGGESRTGKLIDVQSDYLVLVDEEENNVYYALPHVQSISENAKANSALFFSTNSGTRETIRTKSFEELLRGLVANHVKINQGERESEQGTLLAVNDDHIVLYTEDEVIVFYHLQHIKNVYVQMKKEEEIAAENEEVTEQEKRTNDLKQIFPYVNAPNISTLFTQLTHTWVSINHGGSETVEGILFFRGSDYCTVVNRDEIIHINPTHIKTISCEPKGTFQSINQQKETVRKMEEKEEVKRQEVHSEKKKEEGKEKKHRH